MGIDSVREARYNAQLLSYAYSEDAWGQSEVDVASGSGSSACWENDSDEAVEVLSLSNFRQKKVLFPPMGHGMGALTFPLVRCARK